MDEVDVVQWNASVTESTTRPVEGCGGADTVKACQPGARANDTSERDIQDGCGSVQEVQRAYNVARTRYGDRSDPEALA